MSDEFRVDPTYVAGYRELCTDTATDCYSLGSFIRTRARSDGHFDGLIMENLRGVVDGYADSAADRMRQRSSALNHTAVELRDTAWRYVDEDNWSARMWGYDPARGGLVENDFPGGTAAYGRAEVGPLEEPEIDEDGGSDYVMQDAGHELTALHEVVSFVTGVLGIEDFDPVGKVIHPLTGNWNALTQKGQVLTIAGDAAEVAAGNLTNALPDLLTEWDGGAADSFEGYTQELSAAIQYEGPLNRVVGQVYMVVADLIKETARLAIQLIGRLVTQLRRYVAGSGWLEVGAGMLGNLFSGENPLDAIRDAWNQLRGLYDDAVALVDMLETLHNDVQEVIEIARDPLGAIEGRLREMIEAELEPLTSRVEEVEEIGGEIRDGLNLVEDLVHLTDTTALENAPTGGFDAGTDPWRD